ncbi:G patch domain-containing protein 4 isoform X2 [Rana temporaria]|uniref:G patch domain-containing protein 4 isoform X2 n=1 Tax=Rana temporaria TaxID=8407 RepID=UPI001AAD60B3|nr:G patch domain-containing protein 4 isoform X2 [Rana temporaria]
MRHGGYRHPSEDRTSPSPAMAGTPSVKSQGMKFAEEHLQRHGWTEGKGLGKRESGISKAIKVKVKCDSAGVGHNSAEQFTFHWWDHVFNKTASSISVEPDQDGVQVKKVTDEDSVVTNKKPRKALTNRDMLYGRFIKSATLLSGGEQPVEKESSSDSSEDEDEKLNLSSATKLTDEDLVKICGGRTAHKGARHGLTMNAKLLRIEEQEQAFMEKYRKEKPNKEPAKLSLEKDVETARKKEKHRLGITNEDLSSNTTQRKKKKRKTVNGEETLEDNRTNGFEEHVPWKEEDTVASKKNVDNKGLVDAFKSVASSETKLEYSKKKKKVKDVDHARSIEYDVQSSKEANDLEDHGQPLEDDIQSSKKKKKKVKEADHLEDHACSIEYDMQSSKKGVKEANDFEDHGKPLENDIQSSKKKKKKVQEAHHLEDHARSIEDDVQSSKKKVKKEAHDLEDHAQPVEDDIQSSKKKKKKVQEAHHLEDHAQFIEDDVQSSKKKKKVKEGADLLEDSGQPLEDGVQSSKKKKRKEEGKDETTEELTNGHQEWAPSEDLSLSKKKKKARRDLKERVEEDESTEDCVQSLKKKKKQKKLEEVDEHMSIEDEVCQTPKKKKKSKNKYRDFSSPGEEPEQDVDDTEHTIRSKKKKRTE